MMRIMDMINDLDVQIHNCTLMDSADLQGIVALFRVLHISSTDYALGKLQWKTKHFFAFAGFRGTTGT